MSNGTKRWLSLAGVAALVALAVLCTFSHVLTADPATIAGRYDVFRYYGPISFFIDYSIHHGELPLWNPLTFCGIPLAANPQAFLFYPPNLLRSLLNIHPTPYATQAGWVVMIGLHLIFMGVCTALFARAHRMSWAASILSALAFTCSALMVRRACEYHFITTMAWLPLILLLVKRGLDAPRIRPKVYYAVGAGLLLGLSILGGFIQIANCMGVTIGTYAFFYRVLHPRNPGDPETGLPRLWARDLCALALLFVVGGLIASVLLLPTAEYSAFTSRGKGAVVPMYSDLLRWTLTRFYQSFVVFAGMRYEAETLRGSGVAVLLLAVAAFTRRARWRTVAVFGAMYAILFDCTLGPPLPFATLVKLLTPFSQSAYSRAYDFALLPMSLLAGLGLDAITEPVPRVWSKAIRSAVMIAAAAVTLIPLARWTGAGYYLPVSHALVVGLPAIVAAVAIVAGWVPMPERARPILAALLVAIVFAEMFAWNHQYIPYMIGRHFKEDPPLRNRAVAFPQDNTRDCDPIANRFLYAMRFAMNGVDPMHLATMREIVSGGPRAKEYHRLVTDWEPTAENQRGNLFLKRSFWLARQWVRGALPDKETLFPSASTVFLPEANVSEVPEVQRAALPNDSCTERTRQIALHGDETLCRPVDAKGPFRKSVTVDLPARTEGREAGPAGAVHGTLVLRYKSTCALTVKTRFTETSSGRSQWGHHARMPATGDREGIIRVPMPDFADARADITIEPAKQGGKIQFTQGYAMADEGDEDGLIRIQSRSANHATLDVGPLDSARILTFLDAAYPGWMASVDGRPVPILRSDDVFKGIVVPPGSHRVVFAFRPKSIYVGGALSAFAGIVACAALWVLRPRPARPA